jgi:hypothetical protein
MIKYAHPGQISSISLYSMFRLTSLICSSPWLSTSSRPDNSHPADIGTIPSAIILVS